MDHDLKPRKLQKKPRPCFNDWLTTWQQSFLSGSQLPM